METTIFKKNEIPVSFFKNKEPFLKKKYSDPSELKNIHFGNFFELDRTKEKIDTLDKNAERSRRAAAKYIHEYELVKNICKKQVISRAYFKLYEMVYFDPIIISPTLNCFFICEAPGGFIECVTDIRRKKNLQTDFISVSKFDQYIKYDRYLEESKLIYSDITDPKEIISTLNKVILRFPNGIDLITADGGFDVKVFNAQEILMSKLLLCEIYMALMTQRLGGIFIIKFFDMFTHNSNVYYFLLCTLYGSVKIIKPKTSRNCNSERYLLCSDYQGCPKELINDLWTTINNFEVSDSVSTLVYPDISFNVGTFLRKISTFNNLISFEQIKTINESIKMVNNKDSYFQNLLLNLFVEKARGKKTVQINNNILVFKNILGSRIKKCTDFLRNYNINTNQIIYRINERT
jgi:23S rRNA U2552 (ribose-2'-O)-methylase RlmE/FtsJ